MMDLREQIARAIHAPGGSHLDDVSWSDWLPEADAVIEVLRQQKPVAYIMRCSNNIVEATIGVSVLPADYSAVKYFTGDMSLSQSVPLYAAPGAQSDLNLSCRSVQARLATQWGYVRRDDAQNAVPEGWQLVPIEPAAEMLDAAEKLDWSNEDVRGNCCNQWHVMLAAAPKPEGK